MNISTRGRYALRVMVDIAERGGDGLIAMKEVAARQDISLKYIERIIPALVSAGLLRGVHGKGGGYRLTRSPADYPLDEILRLTGDLGPVGCPENEGKPCPRMKDCRTRPVWEKLDLLIGDYLHGVTLADIMKK